MQTIRQLSERVVDRLGRGNVVTTLALLLIAVFVALRNPGFYGPITLMAIVGGALLGCIFFAVWWFREMVVWRHPAGQALPRWKVWLRKYLLRRAPVPFWNQRLDELLEDRQEVNVLASLADGFVWVASWVAECMVASLMLAYVIQFVIAPIVLSPDFLTYGLADPVGRSLAWVCQSTGQCDLRYLLAGTAIALPLLIGVFYFLTVSIWKGENDPESVSDQELVSTISAIDERIVHLRADLVLAGVLPLSAEEKAEAAATEPVAAKLVPYERPAPPAGAAERASQIALRLTYNKSTLDIRKGIGIVLLENESLAREVNDHRAARGLEPLPTVEQ